MDDVAHVQVRRYDSSRLLSLSMGISRVHTSGGSFLAHAETHVPVCMLTLKVETAQAAVGRSIGRRSCIAGAGATAEMGVTVCTYLH